METVRREGRRLAEVRTADASSIFVAPAQVSTRRLGVASHARTARDTSKGKPSYAVACGQDVADSIMPGILNRKV